MSLQRNVKPYEILFRLTPSGAIAGCHKRELESIIDTTTGELFASKELDPVPITGDYINAIIGTINAALVLTLQERDTALQEVKIEKEVLQQQLDTVHAELASLSVVGNIEQEKV